MTKIIACLLLLLVSPSFAITESATCSHAFSLLKPICQRLYQVWAQGENELIITGYAWHNRYTYTREKIRSYNEKAWGGGLGKSLFDEKGNWHGLYATAFLDSHNNIEPVAGYAYLKVLTINKDIKTGLGYSILVTSRADINHNIPFPGAVPWASLFIGKATLSAAYVPGSSTNGNVLFILGKYTFS